MPSKNVYLFIVSLFCTFHAYGGFWFGRTTPDEENFSFQLKERRAVCVDECKDLYCRADCIGKNSIATTQHGMKQKEWVIPTQRDLHETTNKFYLQICVSPFCFAMTKGEHSKSTCDGTKCNSLCHEYKCSSQCIGGMCHSKCAGDNGKSNCTGGICVSKCDGKTCKSGCEGGSCLAHAAGMFANGNCIGSTCAAKTNGENTVAVCKGDVCQSNCSGKNCTALCVGEVCMAKCTGLGCRTSCNGHDCSKEHFTKVRIKDPFKIFNVELQADFLE